MKGRNYTVHFALAASLVLFAALAGQVSRWESKRTKFVLREVPQRARTVEPPRVLESFRGDADVLVRFRAGVSEERKQAIAAGLNDRVEDEIEAVEGLTTIDDLDGESVEDIVSDYAKLPEVEYAEPNFEIKVDPLAADSISSRFVSSDTRSGPNDPLLSEQWGLINTGQREGKAGADVSAGYAWERTHGSRKVVVAVLDSGVDYTHEDLAANIWHRPADMEMYFDKELGFVDDYNGFSAVDRARDPMDENGHGTHCAGIIGAEGDNAKGVAGVNWQVEIMPLKFMGRGGFGTTKDAVEAINYVIDRKKAGVNVRVISASWGSRQKSKALEDVIRKAGDNDILFVAAAGNDGMDADKTPHYPSNYKLPNIIAVAALDRKDQLAGFSNYGATSVHIAAPGREILSTWLDGAYEEHSGTAMATPFVAGVAGLVLSVEPNLTVKELRERLLGTVDKTDALKGKVSTGGRLNAARAVGATQIK
jgi:subtilisin family serine protease